MGTLEEDLEEEAYARARILTPVNKPKPCARCRGTGVDPGPSLAHALWELWALVSLGAVVFMGLRTLFR